MSNLTDANTYSLYNRLVELMISVGIDENTGLVPADKNAERDSDSLLINLFYADYEPHVLSAVSASKATLFQPFFKEDPSYPPSSCGSTINSFDSSGEHHWFRPRSRSHHRDDKRCQHPSHSSTRMMSLRPALMKRHLSYRPHPVNSRSVTVPDLPLSDEVIRSMPTFCFPENAKVFRQKPESSVHFLVFTDMSGKKTFATCLTFYKPYILQKEDKDNLCLTLEVQKHRLDGNQTRAYLPQCCILISKYPYFYTMKECLSCMVDNIEKCPDEMFTLVKDFTFLLTLTPVPPQGNVSVIQTFPVYRLQVLLYPPDFTDKPVIDIPLYLVFLAFSVDNILKIFTSVLTEERVVFVSSNYALLTVVMESFINFILPFSWRFTYVPILSSSSLELLEAPGTFMMGCHSKHLEVVDQVGLTSWTCHPEKDFQKARTSFDKATSTEVEGLVVVNIDEGTVKINIEASDNGDTGKSIPDVPREPADFFKKVVKGLRYQTELNDVQRPFYYNIDEERKYRSKKMHQLNREITLAFLELMVNLFRGVMLELKIELRKFNQDGFIETVAEHDRPFYNKVLQTDMFKLFLTERLQEKADFWSDFEAKTRPYVRKVSGVLELSTSKAARKKHLRKQVSISIYPESLMEKDYQIFRLPSLSDPTGFVKACITFLSRVLEECRDLEPRASYLYLRGMFQATQGNLNSALEDFMGLHSTNARLVPTDFVGQLYTLISESDREIMRSKHGSFINDLSSDLKQEEDSSYSKKIWYENRVPLPQKDVVLDEFVDTISLLEIAHDYDTIQRLFFALASPDSGVSVVDQKTLDNFVVCYSENQESCKEIKITNSKLHLEEYILKVSGLIKTDFGTGRMALTEKRLFFLKDVSNRYKDIIKLRDIRQLEKIQLHSFLNKVDALVIKSKDGNFKFTACLKNERNCWFMLIEEMRAGKVVAEATRDLTAIQQAVINTHLIDAVIRSGYEDGSAHEDCVTSAAESLCHFTHYMHEGRHNLPKDTIEALQHRVDPNQGDRDRKTVECLLYTPGCDMLHKNGHLPPRLWCGMGDGKVKVFDATTWELEGKMVQTKSTAACLVSVGETQVWVGSIGIYIIDTETITCNKILAEHQDLVADIVITDDKLHAYSASVGGLILNWEIQTLTLLRQLKLSNISSLRSLKVINEQLWCSTWECITVLDYQGRQIHNFQVQRGTDHCRSAELACFEITNREVWAGFRREGMVVIWDRGTGFQKKTLTLECRGVTTLLLCETKIWVGTKAGTIYIYETDSHQLWKTLRAHDDAVRSLCPAEVRYIMSGAGSKDGKVAIWTPSVLEFSGVYLDNTN